MAWTNVYTATGGSDTEAETFWTYFLDTYLNSKEEWTVTAHPNGDGNYRSVQITRPNIYDNGADSTCHMWVRFYGSIGWYEWRWYFDRTYTTTPGDLGTYTSTVSTMTRDWHDFSGSFRVWESSTDPRAILVTKGKWIAFYWPGPENWMLKQDEEWNNGNRPGDISGSAQLGPYVGSAAYQGPITCGYPVTTSTYAYGMVPDFGGNASQVGQTTPPEPLMLAGVSFFTNTGSNSYPGISSIQLFPRTGTDVLVWDPAETSTDDDRYFADATTAGVLMFNTSDNKYYLTGDSDLSKRFCVFDMGTTEPDFS